MHTRTHSPQLAVPTQSFDAHTYRLVAKVTASDSAGFTAQEDCFMTKWKNAIADELTSFLEPTATTVLERSTTAYDAATGMYIIVFRTVTTSASASNLEGAGSALTAAALNARLGSPCDSYSTQLSSFDILRSLTSVSTADSSSSLWSRVSWSAASNSLLMRFSARSDYADLGYATELLESNTAFEFTPDSMYSWVSRNTKWYDDGVILAAKLAIETDVMTNYDVNGDTYK